MKPLSRDSIDHTKFPKSSCCRENRFKIVELHSYFEQATPKVGSLKVGHYSYEEIGHLNLLFFFKQKRMLQASFSPNLAEKDVQYLFSTHKKRDSFEKEMFYCSFFKWSENSALLAQQPCP